jgi:hypothetical protein
MFGEAKAAQKSIAGVPVGSMASNCLLSRSSMEWATLISRCNRNEQSRPLSEGLDIAVRFRHPPSHEQEIRSCGAIVSDSTHLASSLFDFPVFLSKELDQRPDGWQLTAPRWKRDMDNATLWAPLRQQVNQPPRTHIIRNDEAWKLTNTDAAQRRKAQRHHILGDEARRVTDCGRGTARSVKPPFVLRARIHRKTREPREVCRSQRLCRSLNHAGTRHQPLRAVRELSNYKITIVEWRKAHADREIEPFVDNVYEAVRAFEYHLDIGVRLQETSDHFPDLEREQ